MELVFIFNRLSRLFFGTRGGLFHVRGRSDSLYEGRSKLTPLGTNIAPRLKLIAFQILVVLQLRCRCREKGVRSCLALDASRTRRAVTTKAMKLSAEIKLNKCN
jgi:hypothetical protein